MSHNFIYLLAAILLAIIGFDLPISVYQGLYTASITIKAIIMLVLPIVIACLLFKTIIMLSSRAKNIIVLIFGMVCLSNFLSTFLSHYVGEWVYGFDMSLVIPKGNLDLQAFWTLSLPTLISNDKAIFSGILVGFSFLMVRPEGALVVATKIERYINRLLSGFVYIIPLFVAGFVAKLKYDGIVGVLVRDYATIFLVIAFSQLMYVVVLFLVLNNFKLIQAFQNIFNMVPAAISGFSTMSSAASMPLTIIGAEKNAKNKDIARSIIPATVNIHLVGDCFAIPIFAYAVLKSFGLPEPSLLQYLVFAFYFVLAKFSVAAIPGGGIIVMLPILQEYLGFNSDMMSLITALYILFDPVITCANVLGNGAFAKMMDNVVGRKLLEG